MEYEVTEHGPNVEIVVRGAAEQEPRLLESLQDCQSGNCGCPTDQYDRLAAMEVESEDGDVTVRLQPRFGEQFDAEQLRACLDYTLTQVDQE